MSEEQAGGYISKITFNNKEFADIRKDDIIVFVGPNNAGKSQSLKDIYALSSKKLPSIVISDIAITKNTLPVSSILDKISVANEQGGYINYAVLGQSMTVYGYSEEHFQNNLFFGEFRDLFICNLDTSARLTICNAPNSITRDTAKQHPIHYAAFDRKYRKWLSDNFKKAFGVEVTPNTQYGGAIPLCMGIPVKLDDNYEDEQMRQEAYAEILSSYEQVQKQGDGIKSFTGILLYLMLDYFRTYLIDEPESFLHPPQARIMGQIIAQTLSDNQQAFISTHSEEIIKGLLEVCPNRIKIIRITREGDNNLFSTLNNENFGEVWNDPLLKYSNIMSSLFHKSVVLCESDSDCKMYAIIESYMKQSCGRYSETLFIHCGGKHRMAKIAMALRALKIDVKLIPDIDIMNDEIIFRGIIEAFNIEWTAIERDYNTVVSNLHSPKEKVNRKELESSIIKILDRSSSQNLSNQELRDIRAQISTVSKWEAIKKSGTPAIPAGDATVAYKRIEQLLKDGDIFIVPVGELECFIKEVGGHGPEWTNKVLETYPDLNNDVYSQIKQFISSMSL